MFVLVAIGLMKVAVVHRTVAGSVEILQPHRSTELVEIQQGADAFVS
jgi:hypothetical protein